MRYTICTLILVTALWGCAKLNEEELLLEAKEQELCTKDTMSYARHIAPLVSANCMPCHSADRQEGGVILDSYTTITNFTSTGLLLGVIRHEPGFSAMPKSAPRLNDCQIRAFEIWIGQGAPNN